MENRIGKIAKAVFTLTGENPKLVGIEYGFVSNGVEYTTGAKYFCDTTKNYQYQALTSGGSADFFNDVTKVLHDAKVTELGELVGKPVTFTTEGDEVADFRILTELI